MILMKMKVKIGCPNRKRVISLSLKAVENKARGSRENKGKT